MHKKILLFFIVLLSVTGVAQAYDFSAQAPSGHTLYYNITGVGTAEVTSQRGSTPSYTSLIGGLAIPASVVDGNTTYTVVGIGIGAFTDCSGLTSLTIPSSVTSIGTNAFYGCSGLSLVEFTGSLTSIGRNAFYGCSGLTSLTLPGSVTSIGDQAFLGCSGLASLTIPASVTSIGNHAFFRCTGLTSLSVESGNTVYDSRGNCNAIIETSTNTLIYGCTNTVIPNSVTSIGERAFFGFRGLASMTIPGSVTSIGEYAFSDCRGLTSLTISGPVTSIGRYAFCDCQGLASLELPNTVTSIGASAFEGCYGLTSVELPGSLTSIENTLFARCTSLTSVVIPNSVTSIGQQAFAGCILTSLTIPGSVTSMGVMVFTTGSGMTSIECLAEVPPTIVSSTFYSVPTNIPVYVPCGKVADYQAATGWNRFTNIQEVAGCSHTVAVAANDGQMGSVDVGAATPAETLLTVITPSGTPGDLTPQYSVDGIATLNAFAIANTGGAWAFDNGPIEGYLNPIAVEGYTITRVAFTIANPDGSVPCEIPTSPFVLMLWPNGSVVYENGHNVGYVVAGTGPVTSLSVYGYKNPVIVNNQDGTYTANHGDVVELTATPYTGNHFVCWREADTVYSRTADTVATITGDRFLVSFFAPDTHDVFVICNDTAMGDAGVLVVTPGAPAATIEPFAEVEHGATISISAVPRPGYHFVEWHEDDTLYSRTADTVVTVLADRFLVAIFALDTHEWVDMGFGLLWATCNVGATNPWDYGDYFAWGETQPKSSYSWETYIWGDSITFTRYTHPNDTLLPEDDAATANWGGDWRMPTRSEWNTLATSSLYTRTHVTNYQGSGRNGIVVTCRYGRCEGNSIFLPYAGLKLYSSRQEITKGYYLSGILQTERYAHGVRLESSTYIRYDGINRRIGASVRAVRQYPTYTVAAVSSNDTMGSVTGEGFFVHGETDSLTATPNPGYHFVEWREADTVYSRTADTVVTVTADRFLVAIFAQDTHAWVDMGDGVLWATCNIGAVNPWDYGEYYAWGETQPKSEYSWDTYLWGDSVTFTRYTHTNDTLLPEDDAATANWGAEWRMPTRSEWVTLATSNHYSRTYVANYQGSGRRGIVVTRLSGRCRGNSIFLPYAGYKRNTGSHAPTIGAYFSNILSSEQSAHGVVLDNSTGSSFIRRINWSRCVGASVRAVRQYPTYTVAAVSGNDTMGSVTGDGFFVHGETDSLTATPNAGYHFVCWVEADTVYSRSADTVVTVTGDRSFTAVFAPDMSDLVLTNVSCRIVGRKLCVDYQFVNQGEVDYTETIGFTVYRNHYRGEILCGGPLMVIDEDMLAFSGNVATRSYIFGRNVICSLDPEDSLVIAINDMGFGVGHHAGAQPERDTLNNIAVLHFNSIFPNRHAYSVDEQAACDSLTWVDDSTYRASTDTPFVTVTSFYNGTPCDSIVRLDLTINHSTAGDTVAVVCDSLTWYGVNYTSSTSSASHTSTNAAGCDSVVTLNLTVNHSTFGDTVAVVCDSMEWYGTTYSSSTSTASHTSINTVGCDSVVTLHLTVNHSTFGDTAAVVCDSMQWYWDTYTESAEPTQLFEAANADGCDSTVTLHLTVNHSNTGDTSAIVCDSMAWYGVTYTSTPSSTSLPSHTITNVAGCDSVVTLHLTVNYSNTGDTTAVVCDSLAWYGTTYTSSTGTASHTSTNIAGCDSIVTLHLTVNYSNTGDTSAVVCDSLTWYGTTYTSSTSTASHTHTNAVGCDSVVTLNLTVNYSNTGDTTAVECDSFVWYGSTYISSTDTANRTWTNVVGCDSVVTLHLTVNYQNTGDTTAVECDSFVWYGETYTSSTSSPSHISTNAAGCDSVVTLHLTVNYQNTGDTTAIECDQFSWYEHSGIIASVDTLTHLFAGANQWGCDSTVTLDLTVNYSNTGDTTAVECDQFTWYGETYTSSTSTPSHTHTNAVGCDSVVTLHLTVNYQNTGDTSAVECDQFSWYEHSDITSSINTLTHLFAGANQWGCDSTVTLNLTVNYSNTGDTNAVECDHFIWYGTDYTVTAAPTHVLTNIDNCDSTVTLHLTVNYQNTGDTTAVECDQFTWYGTNYTATAEPTHLFAGGNQWGCDSTLTLHLTVHYQNTGDTTAVECDQFSWWEHTGLTVSSNTLTHLFTGGNQWGCDSTLTLHLTIHYQNTGDTTAVECDQFSWWEHTGLTVSVDTLTHLFVGGNQWGCDSTVTLDLTVNYQNTGDTTAVECDQFSWYEHHNLTTSINTLRHLFAGANQWGCDSTVTLDLTVNYQNTGDTTAVECDQFSWYEHQNLTVSSNNLTHTHVGANMVNCDSVVTLHLTIHYQNTGDTSAITYEPYNWYEHQSMDVTQNVEHTFVGANQWGCDSTVTLHLRYALFATNWAGPTTVIYNSQPQTALGATYVDDTGRTQQVTLTFTNGSEVITTPNYPVTAGVWNVLARPILPVDSLYSATSTLTILPATVYVSGAEAQIAKVVDGNTAAVVTDIGTLNNIQGSDALTHTTTAAFNDATVGEGKTITLTYTLQGTAALLNNYTIDPATEVYTTAGAIVDPILPAEPSTFDVEVYGYCVGTGNIGYHLASGNPDQYKLDFEDSRFTDVDWTDATGANGTLLITVPAGLPTGDYTATVTFRERRFPWIESAPMTVTFHVDLPSGYVKPLFDNVIALVDTCQCFTDIQWYHRANSSEVWKPIPGATGYYYREVGGLTGEYFVNAKMYGVPTYTCPQSDFVHLVSDGSKEAKVTAWPNPSSSTMNVLVEGSDEEVHTLRVLNTVGVELENRTFEGPTTTLDVSTWQRGSYVVSVDGMVVRVVKG